MGRAFSVVTFCCKLVSVGRGDPMGLEKKPLEVGRGVVVAWPVGLLILVGKLAEVEVRAGVD